MLKVERLYYLLSSLSVYITDLENLTFGEYLRTTDLTEDLIHYVSMCIAMKGETVSALEVKCISSLIVLFSLSKGCTAMLTTLL